MNKNTIDRYAYSSKIKHWNPGFKLFLGLFTLVLCVSAKGWLVSFVVFFSMSYLTVGIGKIRMLSYLRLYAVPLTFLILSGISIVFDFSYISYGDAANIPIAGIYVVITKTAIRQALQVSCKAMAALSALYMISLSTVVSEILGVLQDLHLPGLVIELMYLIYRYIFVLFEVFAQMRTAAKSRLGYASYPLSIRTFGKILANLLVVSLKKANRYYDAMAARGYEGTLAFLQEEKPPDKKLVVIGIVYLLALFGLVIGVNWR